MMINNDCRLQWLIMFFLFRSIFVPIRLQPESYDTLLRVIFCYFVLSHIYFLFQINKMIDDDNVMINFG